MGDVAAHRTGSQAVERALRLLRAFESGPPTRSLSELSQGTSLALATTHRLVRALCNADLLRQDPQTERYGLGAALVPLGTRAADALGVSTARPILESLARATGESVNLGTRVGSEVLVLLSVPSSRRLRFDQPAGTRVPAHVSAMGKVLLAFDPNTDELVRSLPDLTKMTPATITSRTVLRNVLERTRARGWAMNDEERDPGVRTIAAPVRGADGSVIAAVAVQGPSSRMTDDKIQELLPTLVAATNDVSARLPQQRPSRPSPKRSAPVS
ncbi:MAG: IclR family transcriptional regulator [Acidimicrobiales bacterium]|jgi:DNA-binding IclR family transcriptional regulator